ncbi:hypothetical protein B0H13DRAFT_2304357 [Mycena leptocephala]|nr:hypothetical protein B0H13DRAFT_2304357 [Mycena leptocephala]
MAIIPGTKESYIGAFVECIIYGVYLSVFFECSVLCYKKKARGVVQAYLLITTILMFIFITVRCIIDIYRCVTALREFYLPFDWRYQHTYRLADNDDVDFGPPNGLLEVLSDACWFLVSLVADVFIVFRTFIVWDRNWLVILIPSMLCLASTGPVLGCVAFSQLGSAVNPRWGAIDWLTAIVALTLATNIICTGLISFKIIQVHRHVAMMVSSTSPRSISMRIPSVIIESAAIYTAVLLATVVVAQPEVHGFASYILVDCLPATIGVVFSSIIIRLSRGTSSGENTGNAAISSLGHFRQITVPLSTS